jgi:hypothetical protein
MSIGKRRSRWIDRVPGLRSVYDWWMAFARVLGLINATILLTVVHVCVLTPLGFVRRMLGHDTLGLRFDRGRDSYWVPVDPAGPGSRPTKPF